MNFPNLKNLRLFHFTKRGWDGEEILRRLINTILLGLIGILIFAAAFSKFDFLKIVSTALLLAGASCISGAFLGFLFGIPRTGQAEGDPSGATAGTEKNGASHAYRPNTNLEQISDWLTKILVGVGLTQINEIGIWFNNVLKFLTPYIGYNPALVSSIIIYFLVSGFILGFLWSRLYMAGAIMKAEREALKEEIVKEVQNKTDEKEQNDAKALSVINQLLDGDAGVASMSQETLNEVVAKASPVVKVTIFNQAQSFRQDNWKDGKPEKLHRVVPVFKALIACDTENKYHRNHGQLGYTLKDKTAPEYEEAEAELTSAMSIRDKTGKEGKWLLYEFNRAYCRIKINQEQQKEAFPVASIYQDLQKAAQSRAIRDIIQREGIFIDWLKAADKKL